MKPIFDGECGWYKGNLHTHTTVSDGRKAPKDVAAAYAGQGYHFLSLTDHLICSDAGWQEGLLLLPGVEIHDNHFRPGRVCHITGIGMESPVNLPGDTPPQKIINALRNAGAFVSVAHPFWSLMHHQDLLDLTDYDAVEIFNTVSLTHSGRGDSTDYLDVLAAAGRFPAITAADDAHFYDNDAFGGFVWVNAPELTVASILAALRARRFYASQGPRIEQIWVGDGKIRVAFSQPVVAVRFISDAFYSGRRVVNGPLTQAEYVLTPGDHILRVECEDDCGRRAWSQYLPVEDMLK